MAINTAPTPLTIAHIEFLADFRGRTHMYHTLSATKRKLANELHNRKLLEDSMDEDNKTILKMTSNGMNLLQHLVLISNQWVSTL